MQQMVVSLEGSDVWIVKEGDGEIWVSITNVCLALGLNYKGQIKKLREHYGFPLKSLTVSDVSGKRRTVFCIRLSHIDAWIFNINSKKVSKRARCKLESYHNLPGLLFEYFRKRVTFSSDDLEKIIRDRDKFYLDRLKAIDAKLDERVGFFNDLFGDPKGEIHKLVMECSEKLSLSPKEVWGMIQRDCNTKDYRRQNSFIKNYLRNLLGRGLTVVKNDNN